MRTSTQAVLEEAFQRVALRERAEALSDAGRCIERAIQQGKSLADAYGMVIDLMGEAADDLIAMSLCVEGDEVKQ